MHKAIRVARRIAGRFRRHIRSLETASARSALLRSPALSDSEKRLLKRISIRVAPDDTMFDRGRSYLGVGISAMRCIDRAVRHTQTNVHNILDLPCGHGRVLRFLRAEFGKAGIIACEIDPKAVRFCERTFNATGVLSTPHLSKLIFSHQFDLVWCGSLVTHLDEERTTDLLRCFEHHLAPGGVCLFTTHGHTVLKWLQTHAHSYGLSPGQREKLLAEFSARGYGYADYDQPGYGVSLVSFERMAKIASGIGDWVLVMFLEQGWGDHQDVYGFIKPVTGYTPPTPLTVRDSSTKRDPFRTPMF
jgi:2-polyprenyl-3-methyl-5-hydroxy-6-metoxy-1,4-benzoquinol methylase